MRREKSITRSLPTVNPMERWMMDSNPIFVTWASYSPTRRSGTRYLPCPLVITVRVTPVLTFLTCTLASGTRAPVGSVTVPEMIPFVACAWSAAGVKIARQATSSNAAACLQDMVHLFKSDSYSFKVMQYNATDWSVLPSLQVVESPALMVTISEIDGVISQDLRENRFIKPVHANARCLAVQSPLR